MIHSFGFKNFYSFKEGCDVSYNLPTACPEEISQGNQYGNLLCVKGKNASGKTNLIKSLDFLSDFCTDSFSLKPDENIGFNNHFTNDDITQFYIEFCTLNDPSVLFKYELETTETEVISETLLKKGQRWVKIIERKQLTFTHTAKELNSIKQIKLRKNASFISTEHQYTLDKTGVLESVYDFFNGIRTNVFSYGLIEDNLIRNNDLATDIYSQDTESFELAKELIKHFDTGVENIKLHKKIDPETKDVRYIPVFYHNTDQTEFKPLSIFEQSSGTRTLFTQLFKYSLTLRTGGVLCIDEFDKHLHPDILPELLKLFTNNETNPLQAQFLFTTHDADILDIMGQYRTYIIDKENNESFCYRLDEIPGSPIRNDRSLSKIYKAGKVGGTPQL